MGDVGTFPFGWVRGFRDDNWQIIWDPKSELIVAQAAVSKQVVELGKISEWMEAKVYADNVISDPESYFG
ncbi:MAG: hypothetical protein AAF462_01930 [Thermodesulfobacteriota bacterium]